MELMSNQSDDKQIKELTQHQKIAGVRALLSLMEEAKTRNRLLLEAKELTRQN